MEDRLAVSRTKMGQLGNCKERIRGQMVRYFDHSKRIIYVIVLILKRTIIVLFFIIEAVVYHVFDFYFPQHEVEKALEDVTKELHRETEMLDKKKKKNEKREKELGEKQEQARRWEAEREKGEKITMSVMQKHDMLTIETITKEREETSHLRAMEIKAAKTATEEMKATQSYKVLMNLERENRRLKVCIDFVSFHME